MNGIQDSLLTIQPSRDPTVLCDTSFSMEAKHRSPGATFGYEKGMATCGAGKEDPEGGSVSGHESPEETIASFE